MRSGISLQELAKGVQDITEQKRDFLAPKTQILMDRQGRIMLGDAGVFDPTQFAYDQMFDELKIPRQYAHRIMESGELGLMSDNVNTWLAKAERGKRMIRTVGPKMRAYLSDRYRPLDNHDLLQAVLPIFQERQLVIQSANLGEDRMYLKATLPALRSEIKVGDEVEAGIVISNSEIGMGSLRVEPLIMVLRCTNGMVMNAAVRKYHVGKRSGVDDEGIQHLLSDQTRRLNEAGFWASVRDVVANSLTADVFEKEVAKMRESTEQKIEGTVEKVVEVTAKHYTLSDKMGASILEELIRGGDLTRWGLANAVTAVANTAETYEAATLLEEVGGNIIEMERVDWEKIAKAA